MFIDWWMGTALRQAGQEAHSAEVAGYDMVWAPETTVDPFLPLLLASEHTERVGIGTAVAVAFARSPMTVAQLARNLQDFSGGRFVLGLGSQIKPHIEKRFSMPWSHPAARMREFVCALRAIWEAWQDHTELHFTGDFYTHTLMTPFFDPGPSETGPPKIFLAAVGSAMTRVAGEVADGMLVHGFTTERYLREVTVPTIESALASQHRDRSQFQLSHRIFVVTGADDEQTETAMRATRRQIAFYGSTPAYRGILECHGWGDLQTELRALSKRGDWEKMGDLIDDDVLDAFAVVAPPDLLAGRIRGRLGDLVDRISLYTAYETDADVVTAVLSELKAF